MKTKWTMSKSNVRSVVGICCFCSDPSPERAPSNVVQRRLTLRLPLRPSHRNMTQACLRQPCLLSLVMGSPARMSCSLSRQLCLHLPGGVRVKELSLLGGCNKHVWASGYGKPLPQVVRDGVLTYHFSSWSWCPSLGFSVLWANSHFQLSSFELESVACNPIGPC